MSDLAILSSTEGLDVTEDGDFDGTLETAVNVSLFGPKSYWGDYYAARGEEASSKFGALVESGLALTNATRIKAEDASREDLAWLLDNGATSLTVTASIPAVNMLGLVIDIVGPTGNPVQLRYAYNWLTQEVNPW